MVCTISAEKIKKNLLSVVQSKKYTLFILAEKLPIHTMLIHYLYFTLETYFYKGKENKTLL